MAETHTRHMVVTDGEDRMMGVVSQHHLLERLSVLLMEENNSQMELRLDLMLEATGVGTWEFEHRTDRLSRSPALRAMLGYGVEQADGGMASWLGQIHQDDLPGVKTRFEAALGGEAPLFESEYRTRNRDGQWQWISVRGRVVERDERGTPLRSAGIAVDVSAAKAMQRELEEERRRLGTLIRTIPDLVWVKDTEGVYLECNPAFERLYGTPKAGIVGRKDADFVSPELAEFFHRHDQAAAAAGKPTSNEEWLTFAADGYHGLFETIKTPMRDGDGILIGVLGIARDITAMRYVEASLREREEIHSAILSQALDAIALLDVETLRFVEFNEAAHTNLGYSKEAFARLELKDIDAILSPQEIRSVVDKLRLVGEGIFETRQRRQNGEIRDARVSVRLVSLHGRDYLACIWGDITEHKKAEAQLREQVDELRRWQDATLGRESRILELKHEVNDILVRSGQPLRYASAEEPPGDEP
jgi:PAS domain S-box-containing protein